MIEKRVSCSSTVCSILPQRNQANRQTVEEQDTLFSIINTVKHCAWIIVCKEINSSMQVVRQLIVMKRIIRYC